MDNLSKSFGKLTIPLLVFLTISFSALPAQAKYGGGTGEPNDPYLIFDANQMNAIGADSNDWDRHFILMADIDLSGFDGQDGRPVFNMIALDKDSSTWQFDGVPFTGVFDGSGHTISNFTYISTETDYIGLFGYVGKWAENAEIKDLGLIAPNINAGTGNRVGSLVGRLSDGTVTSCYVQDGSVAGDGAVGGMVGRNGSGGIISNCYSSGSVSSSGSIGGLVGINFGTITDCYSTAGVEGNSSVGGLAGRNYGTITNCYSTGGVSGDDRVGGLVGGNDNDGFYSYGTISNCYSVSDVSGDWLVGGLVGYNRWGTIINCYSEASVSGVENVGGLVGQNGWCNSWCEPGRISNCYSTGSVSGDSRVGGLVGYNEYGEVTASFWDIETSGQLTSDGGTGKTTAEMQTMITFTDAGWDFAPHDVWVEPVGGGYPVLWWQLPPSTGLPSFSGGTGETHDPYVLSTPNDVNRIGHNPRLMAAHFKLTNDIDLAGVDFFIIGNGLFPFIGVFDGNGFEILNFDSTGAIFGVVNGANAEIKNLGLRDPNILGASPLVGSLWDGTITNCYVEGGSVTGGSGLVGYNEGTITNCHSTASVTGGSGLVGRNDGTITNCYATGIVTGGSGLVSGNYGTITDCYSTGSVSGCGSVGGLVGHNGLSLPFIGPGVPYEFGTISNCYSTGSVSGTTYVGGLVGYNECGTIDNCYSTGSVEGNDEIGGLVGLNDYTITDCYATGSVLGEDNVGGLVGTNRLETYDMSEYWGTITKCYSTGSVSGNGNVGGLVGTNSGTITNCHATGSVLGSGAWYFDGVGGLVGYNRGTISDCYSSGDVSGESQVGGLVGSNGIYEPLPPGMDHRYGTISNCYSTGSVSGGWSAGGLVGDNTWCGLQGGCYKGEVWDSFWDTQTSGQPSSDGGTGLPTDQMQMQVTFMDAGWDFNTPVWTIDEGVDYPQLWWEFVPVLHAEPEVTLGTSNTITWEPVPGANDYYAECAEDANFTSIIYNSGWITETSCEFTGLQLGQRYWYSVKARNSAGIESQWSNVESSLQGTLADAVDMMLDPDTLKNKNMKNALLNKINAALNMIAEGFYAEALDKLQNDILQKTDGCAETGEPDKNDWIITCEAQNEVYPLIIETIEHVTGLMNQ